MGIGIKQEVFDSLKCRQLMEGEAVGVYLNSKKGYTLYTSEVQQPYFVDKSKMLQELFPLVSSGNKHICITRPRRFGKTVMANMIDAFFLLPVIHQNFLIICK